MWNRYWYVNVSFSSSAGKWSCDRVLGKDTESQVTKVKALRCVDCPVLMLWIVLVGTI
jgi:hypothetical protein